MIRNRLLLATTLAIILLSFRSTGAQQVGTLHSSWQYRGQPVDFCLNFRTGLTPFDREPCDLRYGSLGIDNDFDWLQTSMAQESRNVIKDLGDHSWDEDFKVPTLEPLRKLEPGEKRLVSIDVSGADGAPGRPGTRGAPGNTPGFITTQSDPSQGTSSREHQELLSRSGPEPPKPKREPKLDPAIVKAIIGHVYVVRVVDETSDYYALVRVDDIQDRRCSVSWKIIPSPTK